MLPPKYLLVFTYGYNSYQMCKAISVAFFFYSSLLQGVTIERICLCLHCTWQNKWHDAYVYFKVKELSITLQALIARTTIGETTGKYQYKLIKAFVF